MTNPYETPDAELGIERHDEPEYVGFWLRLAAFIIDNLIIVVLFAVLGFVLAMMQVLDETSIQEGPFVLVQFIFPILFFVLFWIYRNATPGKLMLSTEIIDARTGKAPSKGQYVVRYIGYYLSSIVLGLGFIWIAFDDKKQGWHDKMAGTLVVRAKGPVRPQ